MTKEQKLRNIAELLESDDELRDSYEETPGIPAYIDDKRFSKHEVSYFLSGKSNSEEEKPKVKFLGDQSCADQVTEDLFSDNEEICTESSNQKSSSESSQSLQQMQSSYKKTLISKGYLTKRDLFFVKSIEQCATDTMLLWFIEFLNSKAVKPPQRSCLVPDISLDSYTQLSKLRFPESNMKYYLKLVVD